MGAYAPGGSGAAVAAAGRHFRLQRGSHFVLTSGFPSVCRDPPRDAFGFPLGSRVTYEHARKRMRCTRARGARPREQRQPGRRRFDKQYDMLASCNFQVRLFVPLFPTFTRPQGQLLRVNSFFPSPNNNNSDGGRERRRGRRVASAAAAFLQLSSPFSLTPSFKTVHCLPRRGALRTAAIWTT